MHNVNEKKYKFHLNWILQGSFHLFNCCLELLPLHLHLYQIALLDIFSSSKIVVQLPPSSLTIVSLRTDELWWVRKRDPKCTMWNSSSASVISNPMNMTKIGLKGKQDHDNGCWRSRFLFLKSGLKTWRKLCKISALHLRDFLCRN